jgi:hypothetical protein
MCRCEEFSVVSSQLSALSYQLSATKRKTPSPLEVKANALGAFVRGGGSDCAAIAGAALFGLAAAGGGGVFVIVADS